MTESLVAASPQCDAITGSEPGSHGWAFVRCETRLGLNSFTDQQGTVRSFCGSLGHRRNVERRFGTAERCYLCGRATDELAVTVNLGAERLGLMCSYCCDDLEPLTQYDDEDRDDDGREGQPEFNGAFR